MTDLQTLTDAFTELERRADALPARTDLMSLTPTPPVRRGHRITLVAASAVGVAAVAGGAVLLTDSGNHTPTGAQPTASTAAPTSRPAPGVTSSMPVPPSSSAPNEPQPSHVPTTPAITRMSSPPTQPERSGASRARRAAESAAQGPTALAAQLRAVLGSSAQVAVAHQYQGPVIIGTITLDGRHGGFDLQTMDLGKGSEATCEDPDRVRCTVHHLSDGSSLATGSESVQGGGVTRQAEFVRADGRAALMHVSTESDPKGDSTVLGSQPPLTIAQMTSVVTSAKILAAS